MIINRIPLDDKKQFFYSYDLGCCAALLTSGYNELSIDWQGGNRALFIIRRADGINKSIDDYWADKLEVNARSYFDNLKMIKNRLRSG